jgi:2-keto-4-pentenoate hydratase/2-oxohepta-3-ene-1,7-dioic acid hydratase in catechol pathway
MERKENFVESKELRMKLVRFQVENKVKYGIMQGDSIQVLAEAPFRRIRLTAERCETAQVRLLAPVLPSKIVALGLNYRSHAEEFKREPPAEPLIFLKPSTSVIGPGDDIVYPPSSQQVDYESEMAIVIGTEAKDVPEKEALGYILGYTCLNDVTARDQQRTDKQWTRAKSYDTFAPIGPHIETELDPGNQLVESYLNGECKQRVSTADLIFPVPRLVSFISRVMTLLPGDIIATGTPAGIGPMSPGDVIEIKISGIGTLKNKVAAL